MVEGDRGRYAGRLNDLGRWSEQDAADFESARAAIGAVIAAYSSRLGQTVDVEERAALVAAQQRYARERRLLTLDDREQIERVMRDYPALAREVSQPR